MSSIKNVIFVIFVAMQVSKVMSMERHVSFCETPRIYPVISAKRRVLGDVRNKNDLSAALHAAKAKLQETIRTLKHNLDIVTKSIEVIRNRMAV